MKKFIVLSLLALNVSFAHCQFNPTYPYVAGGKKIIEFGWDMPTARWMAKNTAAMNKMPFDGVIFSPAGHLNVLYAWEQSNWQSTGRIDTANLLAITWGGKANSFINLWSGQDGIKLSYFDDNFWIPVLANMRYIARLAKKAGIAGISFDTEAYSTIKPFDQQAHLEGHTLVELNAKVRQRGAEMMAAWQGEYPDIKILSMFLMSFTIPTWELIPVFADGMLSAVTTAKLIEGQEMSYYYSTTNEYFNSYTDFKTTLRNKYCSPANYAKHATNFQISKAAYADYVISVNSNTTQLKRWEHNIYNALVASDEYVWVYTEGFSYWNNPNDHGLPAGAITYPPWAGAVERITSAKSKYNAKHALGWDMVGGAYLNSSLQVSLTTSATVVDDSGPVTLTVEATGGTISKIDLYQNMQKIQSKTTAPCIFTVSDIPTGNYEFIAHVFTSNATGTSNPIIVTAYDFNSLPPTAPTGLAVSNIGLTSSTLSWTAISDSAGITTYEILNNGDFVGTTSSNSIDVTGLICSTSYLLTVKARYGDSNWSEESNIPVTTLDCVPCTLPKEWTGGDIGTTKQTACEDGGVYTFVGEGVDVSNNAYNFRYIYKALSGDGVITAKVESNDNTAPWARSGIMIRESLAAGSKHVDCFVTSANGISSQVKSGSGSTTRTLAPGIKFPCWVRLERIDSTFNAYYSVNGVSWSQVGSGTTVAMAKDVFIGLAATSQEVCTTCSSVISNVSTIGEVTSIDQPAFTKKISIYPNPATSSLTLSDLPVNANISVFTIDGKKVEMVKANTSSVNFNVQQWNKGLYFFQIESENGVVVEKVIVE